MRCIHAALLASTAPHTAHAARDEPTQPEAAAAANAAAHEPAAPFLALLKMLMMGGADASPADNSNDDPAAKTVAELAEHAPGNMSILTDGVERAGLHTAIADPEFAATIFCPTNKVGAVVVVVMAKGRGEGSALHGQGGVLTHSACMHGLSACPCCSCTLKTAETLL